MSLFNELEDQLSLAIENLKRLNAVISSATTAIESAVHIDTADTTPTKEKLVAKKKRASRKKAAKKVAEEQPDLQAEPDPDIPLDPLGDPIVQDVGEDMPFFEETIDIGEVRKRIQEVARQLNGDTQRIGQYMNNRFGKAKLSDFIPSEYPILLEGVEALVAPGVDNTSPLD